MWSSFRLTRGDLVKMVLGFGVVCLIAFSDPIEPIADATPTPAYVCIESRSDALHESIMDMTYSLGHQVVACTVSHDIRIQAIKHEGWISSDRSLVEVEIHFYHAGHDDPYEIIRAQSTYTRYADPDDRLREVIYQIEHMIATREYEFRIALS